MTENSALRHDNTCYHRRTTVLTFSLGLRQGTAENCPTHKVTKVAETALEI